MRPGPSLGETESEPKYVNLNQTKQNLIQTKQFWFGSDGCPNFIVFVKFEFTKRKVLDKLDFIMV